MGDSQTTGKVVVMPAYDYECSRCHLSVEVKVDRDHLEDISVWCLRCGEVMKRRPPLVNVRYRGTGFTKGHTDLEEFGKEKNGDG